MADLHQQWLFKDRNGKIVGPFRTSQILDMISSGRIAGDELVAKYPGGEWFPVSREPDFYDKILEALLFAPKESASDKEPRRKISRAQKIESIDRSVGEREPSQDSLDSPGSSENSQQSAQGRQRGKVIVEESNVSRLYSPEKDDFQQPDAKTKQVHGSEEVVELVNTKKIKKRLKKEKAKAAGLPIVLVSLALALALFVLIKDPPPPSGRIHLLAPQKGRPPIEAAKARKLLSHSIGLFQRDTFEDYLEAQNYLVQILEGVPKTPDAISLLCLTYRELWPYSYKDESDLKAVSTVMQMAALGDSLGYHSATCNSVFLLLNQKYQNAEQTIDSALVAYPTGPALYEFKADLLGARRDFSTAVAYLQKTRQLWKEWLKPHVMEASYLQKNGDFAAAAALLKHVLQQNREHRVAQIYLGILESRNFRHLTQGYDLIRSGVGNGQNLSPLVLGEAYLELAEIALASNKRQEAVKWAEKSYAAYPGNQRVREILRDLKGSVGPASAEELMFLGEQFFKQGDYRSAYAHFKAAFQQNPKNAAAALRAAESSWRLNQSKEAIDWLRKATQADPKYLEAYITLADYYSQRFDFLSAEGVLRRAQRVQPRSYEVQRGLALFELRRKSYQGAINFGLKALQLYETDLDTHLILVDAYLGIRNYSEAIKYSRRAIEIDSNSVDAQIAYGKVLVGAQGVESAVYHMQRQIRAFPHLIRYRIALGEIYYDDQRYNEAESNFRSITEVEPNNKTALLYLAKTYRELEKYQEALAVLLNAATLDPSDAEPLFEIGLLYIEAKKYGHAVTQFKRVLAVNPHYPRTHFSLGQAAFLAKDYKTAIDEALAERRLNPSMADSYLLAGDVYLASGQYSNCVGEFQEAIRRRPQGAQIYVKVAQCYRLSGSLDYALKMLDLAKSKESGYSDIYKELGALYETKGEMEAATAAYAQYFILSPNAPDRSEIEKRLQGASN